MKQVKNVVKIIVALFIPVLAIPSYAQDLRGIQDKFENYSRNNLSEKLFVHTDRSTYFTGEILWFKVYYADGFYNKPLDMSKVAYVDVLDEKQNRILEAKISLDKGSGSGSLFIPVTVANGNYKLRAYTNWMKNFDAACYFEKTLTIINPQVVPEATTAKTKVDPDLRFFPEGGNLISDLPTKVAVKATDPNGSGRDFKGIVINEKNDTVVKFSSLKFGMGRFSFTPAKNSLYTSIITFGDGKSVTKNLPASLNTGYSMQLKDDTQNQLDITVRSNSNPSDNILLFAHTRNVVKTAKEAVLTNGVAHFSIDKALLGEGISHITIFTGSGQPVCERLYFKRPAERLMITAVPDQQQYGCRKKVNISVNATIRPGVAANADLSMSVSRVDGLQSVDQGDILSYLWLQSDLRGYIESSGYYFENNTAEANEAVDNLMLTQGWRKFNWNDILNDKQPAFKFLPETYGHIITAKIASTNNMPGAGVISYLTAPGKRLQLFPAKSDQTGLLLFNTKDLYTNEIIVEPKPDSSFKIDILSPFSEQYSQTPSTAFVAKPSMQDVMETRNIEMQVQNIYAGDSTKQFEQPLVDSSGFYKKPTNTYMLDNYTRFPTMEEVLREYVKEVNVIRVKNKFHIKIRDEHNFIYDPLVLIDGVPVFDADKLMAIDPLRIRKLEVFPQRYFYGPTSSEGILSFTSYKGDLAGLEIDPHAVIIDYEGLQMHRVFYSPVYDSPAKIKSHLPDFRNLLFWSPAINADDRNPVTFYTSDQEGDYIGIIQGISSSGQAGSQYFKFSVKK